MSGFWFDAKAALIAEAFFERRLVHIEGPIVGQPFRLEPWQRELVRELFGWKWPDGRRRYRKLYLEVPRGNGKSTFAAGLALLLLAMDGEKSAKVYGAAADKDQATQVFNTARDMVEESPHLRRRIRVFKNKTMEFPEMRGVYKVISSDAYTKHGLNPHGIVFDELHAQPNRELYDVLNTAMGKRKQPLMIMITTAGFDRNSICWEQHEYAIKVRDGIVDDPTFLPSIWAADPKDDWTSPATWRKANPNYGVSVSEEFLAQECKVALASPAYQNTFRRLYLNQWTQQESRWLDMTAWDACDAPLPDLAGRPCYGGLDLASTTDIVALVLAFPPLTKDEPTWLVPTFWIPGEGLIERGHRDRVPYDAWVRDGYIFATPGNVVDYGRIEEGIKDLATRYHIKEIAYDRWNATQITQRLAGEGLTMVQMGQGFASMSAPSKEMLRLVLSRKLGHGGNPVMRWMADNVTTEEDAAGNIKPSKAKSTQKIDGIVGGVMGIDRIMRQGTPVQSVYEKRGIRTI
jgi:phage terminase large subunit-like protein